MFIFFIKLRISEVFCNFKNFKNLLKKVSPPHLNFLNFKFFLWHTLLYILYTKNKELSIKNLVSVVGFEPTVSCLKGKCINRLCYTLIFFGKFLQDFLSKILQKFFHFFSFSLNLIIYYIIKFRGFQVNC